MHCKIVFIFLFLLHQCPNIAGWDTDEFELFDLVEEINKNFYDVLGVDQSATGSEIRRSYRKLSLQLHPDKNKEDDAEVRFRQLVAVYEVLKDEEKRKKYDLILVNGLPDWRQPVFYYRRVRKLGLLEFFILLLLISTVCHFIVLWSIYLERRFELEEIFKSRKKKDKKHRKLKQAAAEDEVNEQLQEELDAVPKPSMVDLLPWKLLCFSVYIARCVPEWTMTGVERLRQARQVPEEEEEDTDEEEEEVRTVKRRQRIDIPEFVPEMSAPQMPVVYSNIRSEEESIGTEKNVEKAKSKKQGDDWDDEELTLLAKAVAKFPGGSAQRWIHISEMVGRSVAEVTSKSKQLKSGYPISVDLAAQGITGAMKEPITFKKGKPNEEGIITTNEEWPTDRTEEIELEKKTARQRTRNNKVKKTTDVKTLPSEQNAAPVKSSKNSVTPVLVSTKEKPLKNTPVENIKIDNSKQSETDGAIWTQNQQKIFEWSLAQYVKGTPDRWDKIAKHIQGKTKEDCVERFKYLADMIKKKKEEQKKRERQQEN